MNNFKIIVNGVEMTLGDLKQSLGTTSPEKLYKSSINKLKRSAYKKIKKSN